MSRTTRSWVLARRPVGRPDASLFEMREEPVPVPGPGRFLLKTLWLGIDVGPVSRMRTEGNYAEPIGLGDVMPGHAVAQVVSSRHPDVAEGRLLAGPLGWQEHAIRDGLDGLVDVDPERPPSAALGLLGLHGLTAYVGLLEIAAVRAGETVVVSAAAGAVGLLVGQLAKLQGARVVGLTGGRRKAGMLVEQFGFDAAIDHRGGRVAEELGRACPDGVDIYFDNVGGPLQEAVLPHFNVHGRFIVCGRVALAAMADTQQDVGVRDHNAILVKRLRKQGFLVYDHLDQRARVREQLWAWHEQGAITLPESVVEGFAAAPHAFAGMLDGDNVGRRLVHVADPR